MIRSAPQLQARSTAAFLLLVLFLAVAALAIAAGSLQGVDRPTPTAWQPTVPGTGATTPAPTPTPGWWETMPTPLNGGWP